MGFQGSNSHASLTEEWGISLGGPKVELIKPLPPLPNLCNFPCAEVHSMHCGPPRAISRREGTRGAHEVPACRLVPREREFCTLHSSLIAPTERRGQDSANSGCWSSLPSTSAEAFARWADEERTPCSCSPADASPRSQDGKWYWGGKAEISLGIRGCVDGPGTGQSQTQESGTLPGPSLHIQLTGVSGIVGP